MHTSTTPRCPLCKGVHTYRMSKKPVPGTWTVVKRTWNCVACLHQWPASEEDEKPYPYI